jgi:hypothetical protein
VLSAMNPGWRLAPRLTWAELCDVVVVARNCCCGCVSRLDSCLPVAGIGEKSTLGNTTNFLMAIPLRLIVSALIVLIAVSGCTSFEGKSAVPAPGGSFPSLAQYPKLNEPLCFAFSFDHGVPYNPVVVPSSDQGWDFAVTFWSSANGVTLEVENRSPATVPIRMYGAEKVSEAVLTIKPNTRTQFPAWADQRSLLFFIEIYDERAIVTGRRIGPISHPAN